MAKSQEKKFIEIWTDGASKGNPGPGGWGAFLKYGRHEKELWGGDPNTTNNQMELTGPIEALKALKKGSYRIRLHSDSKYVVDGMSKWIYAWRRNGWKTSTQKPVKNADLWKELAELAAPHEIEWCWVKGHAGNPDNERVDGLANKGVEELYKKFDDEAL